MSEEQHADISINQEAVKGMAKAWARRDAINGESADALTSREMYYEKIIEDANPDFSHRQLVIEDDNDEVSAALEGMRISVNTDNPASPFTNVTIIMDGKERSSGIAGAWNPSTDDIQDAVARAEQVQDNQNLLKDRAWIKQNFRKFRIVDSGNIMTPLGRMPLYTSEQKKFFGITKPRQTGRKPAVRSDQTEQKRELDLDDSKLI